MDAMQTSRRLLPQSLDIHQPILTVGSRGGGAVCSPVRRNRDIHRSRALRSSTRRQASCCRRKRRRCPARPSEHESRSPDPVMHPVRSVLGGDGGHPDRYASEPLDPGAGAQGSHGRAAARGPGEGEDFSQTDVSAASPAIAVGPSASHGDRQSSGSPRPRARAHRAPSPAPPRRRGPASQPASPAVHCRRRRASSRFGRIQRVR